MAAVSRRGCIACRLGFEVQQSPTQVHHVIHDRFSTARSSDFATIPLCEGHHQGMFDTTKVAIHREPERWRELYGPDHAFVTTVQMEILGYEIPD